MIRASATLARSGLSFKRNKLQFAAIIGALGLLVGVRSGSSAQAPPVQAPITLKIGAIAIQASAEGIYGVESGIFKKAGLDVQIQTMNNGAAIASAIAGGELDIGLVDTISVINAHTRGLPFVYLAPGSLFTVSAPAFDLTVRGDSPIRSGRDINGGTIAVAGLHNIANLAAAAWIDGNGGNSSTVKFVELHSPASEVAIKEGQIQGVMSSDPFSTYNRDAGFRVISIAHKGIAARFQVNGWVTTKAWIEQHPLAAARFAEAMRQVAVWANSHPQEAAPILAQYTKVAPEVIKRMQTYTFGEKNDPSLVQPVVDAAAHYGYITQRFDAAEIIGKIPR